MFTLRRSLFPPRNLIAPLAGLYPPYLADMVAPVPGADGGINRTAFEAHPEGLYAVIDPPPGMANGDLLEAFLDDKKVAELRIKDEHLDKRWYFFVPKDGLKPGLFTCHYLWTRAGETEPEEPSAKLTLLLEVDDPAGDDDEPFDDWHSELKIVGLPQDVIDNGVTKPWLDTGVPMIINRYQNIAVGDVILATWGSVFLSPHVLTQAEVDGSVEIVVTARPEDILTAGDSAAMIIHYNICDLVYNWSVKWSKATSVAVDAGVSRLEALIIKEAVDGKIILADLDAQDVTLQILIKAGDVYAAGDKLNISVTGTPIPGRPPQTFSVEATVGTPPYIHATPVAYEFVKLFAQGTLDASYVLHKQSGPPPLASKRTFARVIGNPSLLQAPTIKEVIGNILPSFVQAATVIIRFPAITNGDVITLIWLGMTSNGEVYLHQEEHTVSGEDQRVGEVTIHVMGEHIKALEDGSLKLQYRVFNDITGQYGTSESEFLRVGVGSLPVMHPAPKVKEAPNDVLDPSLTNKQVHVLVKPVNWVKGDKLSYHWIGINLNGSTFGSVPITLATVGQTVSFRVDQQYVSANIGYYVTVIYTLWHAATGDYSYSAPLEVLIGIPLGELPAPKVIQAPAATLNPMHALNGVDIDCSYANMDVLLDWLGLKWLGAPGPGTSEDQEKPADATGTVSFHLDAPFIGANINREVEVRYDVQRYGLWTASKLLPLKVLGFQDPDKELPTPEVPQAKAGELRVMELAGNATIVLDIWPFIAPKQLVWLYVEGQASTGAYRINVLTAHELTTAQATQGLDEPLLKTELLKLLHASTATVVCRVAFDRNADMDAAIRFPMLPLTIRQRYEYVTPVITAVKTALSGIVVPDKGLTYDKKLIFEGTATRAEEVDVQVDDISKGTPLVDADSRWTVTADLTEGLHRAVAIAQYEADDKVSDSISFTIAVASQPSITGVRDSKGAVGNNGTTYDDQVEVSVNADPGQKIQLYDGATIIGQPIDLDGKGDGSTTLTGLSQKTYALKAKALYGDLLESPVHIFTAKAHLAITLTSVRHSAGELAPGGTTTDSSVTVTGAFTPLYSVQIHLNNVGGQTVAANASGIWTLPVAVPLGPNTVYAKATGTGQQSGSRSFTRAVPLPPLNFNTNPVTLGGKTYIIPGNPGVLPAFNPGNSVHHAASGGRPPISYWSGNTGVAVVDATGFVTVRGRGTTTITAQDSANQSKSYNVTVTNVIHCIGFGNATWNQANASVAGAGCRIPSMAELYEIHAAYGSRWPMGTHHYWSTDTSNYWWPAPARKTLYLNSGGEGSAKTPPWNDYSNVVGIR